MDCVLWKVQQSRWLTVILSLARVRKCGHVPELRTIYQKQSYMIYMSSHQERKTSFATRDEVMIFSRQNQIDQYK